MEICSYDEKYFGRLYKCFNSVFGGSPGRLLLKEEDFFIRIHQKLDLDQELSHLLIKGEEVLGFVLYSSKVVGKERIIYNGGTGVDVRFRGKKFGHLLLEKSLEYAQKKVSSKAYLEVVDKNDVAQSLYEKYGFVPTRILRCFKRKRIPTSSLFGDFHLRSSSISEVSHYQTWDDFDTGFHDSWVSLKDSSKVENAYLAFYKDQAVGYIILQQHIGRVSRLAVNPQFRRGRIATFLVKSAQDLVGDKQLTFMNVPDDQHGFLNFLTSRGFENGITQIEMVKTFPK